MTDDPNKKHEDGWFVSKQPHEYEYFKKTVQQAHPRRTEDEVAQAILACRKAIAPSEGRAKLTACVNRRLA